MLPGSANRPRPYSTLRDGHIVWVTPEEHTAGGRVKRSRPESDEELRARLKAAGHWHYPQLRGKQLEEQLEYWSMPPRGYVDE